jgi:hypothetical protein
MKKAKATSVEKLGPGPVCNTRGDRSSFKVVVGGKEFKDMSPHQRVLVALLVVGVLVLAGVVIALALVVVVVALVVTAIALVVVAIAIGITRLAEHVTKKPPTGNGGDEL